MGNQSKISQPPAQAQLTWDERAQPFSTQFQDHYFSTGQGRAETQFIFLQCNGLPERWEVVANPVIGELGFGTGLSLLETWASWRANRSAEGLLTFQSVEAFPMRKDDLVRASHEWNDLEPMRTKLIDTWDSLEHGPVMLDDQTKLHVVMDDVVEALPRFEKPVDTWFLDGFAPARNPAMWSAEVMALVAQGSAKGARFTSYTAAGWVRQSLAAAGFQVDRQPGFGNKRHMITGFLKETS